MSSNAAPRLAAASGIAYVVAIVTLNSAESPSNAVLAGEVLALLLFVPFLVGLWAALRDHDATGGWLVTTMLASGLVALAVKLAGVLPTIVAEQGGLEPNVAEGLTRVGEVSFIASLPPLGIALAAAGAIIVRSRALPVWLGWTAAIFAPLLVVNGFDLGAEFGPAFLLFLVWTLAAGVALLRGAGNMVTAPDLTHLQRSGARAR